MGLFGLWMLIVRLLCRLLSVWTNIRHIPSVALSHAFFHLGI